MNAPDDREQRRIEALAELGRAADRLGLTADVVRVPPLVLLYRGGELAGTYRADGVLIRQPGNVRTKCRGGWREAVALAAGL